MTTPKLPEGLEPVAWLDDGLSASNGTEEPSHRVVTDKTKRDMPRAAVTAYNDALVRLSDAQASLLAKEAECEALRVKAARYDWLREQHWIDSTLCVVRTPKKNIVLGADCPSLERLDDAIDAARAAAEQGGAS